MHIKGKHWGFQDRGKKKGNQQRLMSFLENQGRKTLKMHYTE